MIPPSRRTPPAPRRLRTQLQPATALASLAAANRLTTQVGNLDCMRDARWVLADVSRAELAEKESDETFGGAPFFLTARTLRTRRCERFR